MNLDMTNKIQAVILDWAGTVVDFGSVAPTSIFVEAMQQAYNFEISLAEARIPMGMGKWDHIRALGNLPGVDRRWRATFGQPMSDEQVDHIYNTFMPLQKAKVSERAEPIWDALAAINNLRAHGVKIGSCTGYPREVMEELLLAAAQNGYQPDCVVCSDDLAAGSRPGPWMALENVNQLAIQSVKQCVKVDDAVPGIEEGLNAGMWTVGISVTGNAIGLTEEEWTGLTPKQQYAHKIEAENQLYQAGAHYVIDSLGELPEVVACINGQLVRGERP